MSSTGLTTRLNCSAISFMGRLPFEKSQSPSEKPILIRGTAVALPERGIVFFGQIRCTERPESRTASGWLFWRRSDAGMFSRFLRGFVRGLFGLLRLLRFLGLLCHWVLPHDLKLSINLFHPLTGLLSNLYS